MYEDPKPLQIEPLGKGRYKVRSQSDPKLDYLVKWIDREGRYTCDCKDGTFRDNPEKPCKHIRGVKEKFAKVCNLCASKGEWHESMKAPWDQKVTIYICNKCDESLRKFYSS
jgi:hypothetical protein